MNPKEPYINPDILEYLERIYTMDNFLSVKSLEDLWLLQGQRSVISKLRAVHEHQKKNGNVLNV